MADTLKDVAWAVEKEGFDYAFRNWSNFDEVNDPMFHHLRLAYIHAANELEDYLPELDSVEEETEEVDNADNTDNNQKEKED